MTTGRYHFQLVVSDSVIASPPDALMVLVNLPGNTSPVAFAGDHLVAEAKEIARTRKTATYFLEVRTGRGELIAHAQSVAYRTGATPPFLTP